MEEKKTKKTEFKEGERVAIYGSSIHGYHKGYGRSTGVVRMVIGDRASVTVDGDKTGCSYDFHPYQLRKLKKKERTQPREIFLWVDDVDKVAASTADISQPITAYRCTSANEKRVTSPGKWHKFVEVKPKKAAA